MSMLIRDEGFIRCFQGNARNAPERSAVICGERTLSYGELDRRSDAIAHCLRSAGLTLGAFVGISMARSEVMLAALLGVLKADLAYVPMGPAYPRERLAFIAGDSGAQVVLLDTGHEMPFPLTAGAASLRIPRDGVPRWQPAAPDPPADNSAPAGLGVCRI